MIYINYFKKIFKKNFNFYFRECRSSDSIGNVDEIKLLLKNTLNISFTDFIQSAKYVNKIIDIE